MTFAFYCQFDILLNDGEACNLKKIIKQYDKQQNGRIARELLESDIPRDIFIAFDPFHEQLQKDVSICASRVEFEIA